MSQALVAQHIAPGDRVIVGQALGEPVGLLADLFELAPQLGTLDIFCGFSLNPAWQGPVPENLHISTYCGLGTIANLVASGRARLVPASLAQLSSQLTSGRLAADVVLLQVAPADADGYHSLGYALDYVWDAIAAAPVVLVEVNHRLPVAGHNRRLHHSRVVVARETDAALLQAPAQPPTALQMEIARHVAAWVPDGAAVQLGIGGLATAVAQGLQMRRGLKVRSGMLGDWVLDLIDHAALDTTAADACLASLAVGSSRLYERLASEHIAGFALPSKLIEPVIHAPLMAINSAIEVDLLGQVNAEWLGPRYVGAVGGQTEYFRATRQSPGGLAIVALPSSSGRLAQSRIVERCAVVTSTQSDVDIIVTEHGAADIRGTTLAERRELIAAIAPPGVRENLRRADA